MKIEVPKYEKLTRYFEKYKSPDFVITVLVHTFLYAKASEEKYSQVIKKVKHWIQERKK